MAATIGPTDVAVFSASYRIMWISLVFCGSIAGAVAILLTLAFGKGHHKDAKVRNQCPMALSIEFSSAKITLTT